MDGTFIVTVTKTDDSAGLIYLYAASGEKESQNLHDHGADRFPTGATIFYNLACYVAQLGHLDSARARLASAIKLDSECREMALADPDLAPLTARTT